jgi:hypothetical protein
VKGAWDSRFKPIRAFLFFRCWSRIKINECLEQKPILNFTVVQSDRTVFVNLSMRCTMGKNWLCSVMAINGTFRVQYNQYLRDQIQRPVWQQKWLLV